MRYINSTEFTLCNTIVTFGKFDGVHAGHKKLIASMMSEKSTKLKTVVFSFDRTPKEVLEEKKEKTILSKKEKKMYHEKLGIDVLIEYPFDNEFAETSADDFIKNIIVKKLGAKKIVCGDDFRFGKKRQGDIELLLEKGEEYGFKVIVLKKEKLNDHDISSSFIRQKLTEGDIEYVNKMLGYSYFIAGKVIHGKALGRKLGFPTMNITPDHEKLLPPDGVYVTRTMFDDRIYDSITNIGTKGKIINAESQYKYEDAEDKVIETFILNGGENVYGQIVEVQFYKFIRPEIQFDSFDDLKQEIAKNIIEAEEWLESMDN